MLERIINCLCHPKMIAKYFKDKAKIVFLTILVFFGLFILGLGVKTFTSEYFSPNTSDIIVSDIIKNESCDVNYIAAEHKFVGESATINGNGYILRFFPSGNEFTNYMDMADIVINFYDSYAEIEFFGQTVSGIKYDDLELRDFSLIGLKENNINDVYNFKLVLMNVLNSSTLFFSAQSYVSEIFVYVISYLVVVLVIFFTSKLVNPTIDSNVRRKLCFYDGLIFFVVEVLAILLNMEFISYFSILLPLIYSNITFRHIVKVPVNKM